jgi:hypothetical protein
LTGGLGKLLQKNIIYTVSFPPSNGENRRSSSNSYEKLFKKYPPFFFFETDNNWSVIRMIFVDKNLFDDHYGRIEFEKKEKEE